MEPARATPNQPACSSVLGELMVGIVAGNLTLAGFPMFRTLADDPFVNVLAGLGVMLLLFEVGLESTVQEMIRVGFTSGGAHGRTPNGRLREVS